jgi:hypothetical protein
MDPTPAPRLSYAGPTTYLLCDQRGRELGPPAQSPVPALPAVSPHPALKRTQPWNPNPPAPGPGRLSCRGMRQTATEIRLWGRFCRAGLEMGEP